MTLELYTEVALTQDLPRYSLKVGDVATLVDFVRHPSSGEDGCVLEVFNAVGESIAIVSVPVSAVKSLQSTDILQVRSRSEQVAASKSQQISTRTTHHRQIRSKSRLIGRHRQSARIIKVLLKRQKKSGKIDS